MKKYNKYKHSGIDWIGKIPEHWEVTTVGRIANLGRGRVINAFELEENPGEYPVYSSQTKNNGIMGYLGTYDFEGKYVTWTTDGANAGTVSYREGKFNCTNVCGTIQPKNWNIINLKFLPYFLNLGTKFSVRLDINPKLMNNMMAKIPIVIPPLIEQTAIANYLDKKTAQIDQLIADKKRLLELYEEEKTAIINQAVTKGVNVLNYDVNDEQENYETKNQSPSKNQKNHSARPLKHSGIEWLGEIPEHWEVKRFRFVFSLSKGLSITKSDLKSEGIPCISYGEIHSKYGFEVIPERDELLCVDDKFLNISEKSLISRGDFVFADTSEDIEGSGNFTHLHSDEKIFAGYHTIISRLKIEANYRYFAFFLDSLSFRNQIRKEVKGVKVYSITNAILKDAFVLIPPLEEQQQIVNYIEKEISRINAKAEKTKKLIELLEEYKQALISEVVTGKIKVTE